MSVSRRALFRRLLEPAPAPAPPVFPLLRPPGAAAERDFLSQCTRCGDCARACPADAIRPTPARFRGAAGTPRIDPATAPCVACVDMPCAHACPTPALDPARPFQMGTAQVLDHLCMARTGCAVCVERCPVEGAMKLGARRPEIDPEVCVGCGVCQHYCPAPGNAILIRPAERPRV